MSATVNISGTEAIYTHGEWRCQDRDLLRRLVEVTTSTYLPDGVVAQEAAEKLGGYLVSADQEDGDDTGVY